MLLVTGYTPIPFIVEDIRIPNLSIFQRTFDRFLHA